jgi:hypothetical protein
MRNSRLKNPLLVDKEEVELQIQAAEQRAEKGIEQAIRKYNLEVPSEAQMETMLRQSNQDGWDRAILYSCGCIVVVNG